MIKIVMEQASPDIIITSSRSDEKFIEAVRAISMNCYFCFHVVFHLLFHNAADSNGTTFQIRPNREFNPTKGYERLLTLRLFTSLPDAAASVLSDTEPGSNENATSEPRNAYEFMRKRRAETGDPNLQRWTASIRLSNFSAVETSPICVRLTRFSMALAPCMRTNDSLLVDLCYRGTSGLSGSYTCRQ